MRVQENIPISKLTTMRLGGEARYVLHVESLADIPEAFSFAKEKGLPVWMMGGGANTIGRDEGFNGVILLNKLKGMELLSQTADEAVVRAMGGEIWDDLVAFTAERGLSGIEAMSKIPGTVGAAPVQNIGAYGQDMSQVIESVEAYDTKTGELVVIGKEEMQMTYRHTIFNHGPEAGRYFIVAVTLVLENEPTVRPPFYTSLQKYVDENGVTDFSPLSIRKCIMEIRKEKLPDPAEIPSAGSFFKNIYLSPEEAEAAKARGIETWDGPDGLKVINTGYLIEKAGLKGKVLHGFKVSEKAALILINESAKSYADLAAARAEIKKAVFDKFGYEIEQEPVEVAASGGVE